MKDSQNMKAHFFNKKKVIEPGYALIKGIILVFKIKK